MYVDQERRTTEVFERISVRGFVVVPRHLISGRARPRPKCKKSKPNPINLLIKSKSTDCKTATASVFNTTVLPLHPQNPASSQTKNMKLFTSQPLFLLAMCLGAIHEALGATQLTETLSEITINDADEYGMPLDIGIQYVSDFGNAVNAPADNTAWLDYSIASGANGDAFYGATDATNDITVTDATHFTIALPRDTDVPSVQDYNVVVKCILWYRNSGTDVKMDEVNYTFKVNVAGIASSVEISTANGDAATSAGSFQAGAQQDDSEGNGSVTSANPTITLAATSSNVAFGADIVLSATVSGGDHSIWVVTTDNIIASSDATFVADQYEWPNLAVESTQESDTSSVPAGPKTTSVTITLKSVPVVIFDYATIYVKITVHHRDASNDFGALRALRGLQNTQELEQNGSSEPGTSELVAKVTFATDDSGCVYVSSYSIVSATAALAAGAALLI